MNEIDEYTQAWGEGAIVPPAELTVQGEARKKAKQDQKDFESEFADLVAKDAQETTTEEVIGDDDAD